MNRKIAEKLIRGWFKEPVLSAEDELTKALDQTQQATIKQIKINIGFLRQWLNERTSDKLLTNEDLETWLLDKLKKE